jgi:hypothetical protein
MSFLAQCIAGFVLQLQSKYSYVLKRDSAVNSLWHKVQYGCKTERSVQAVPPQVVE